VRTELGEAEAETLLEGSKAGSGERQVQQRNGTRLLHDVFAVVCYDGKV
jgi:hypothetical protein